MCFEWPIYLGEGKKGMGRGGGTDFACFLDGWMEWREDIWILGLGGGGDIGQLRGWQMGLGGKAGRDGPKDLVNPKGKGNGKAIGMERPLARSGLAKRKRGEKKKLGKELIEKKKIERK